MLYSDFIRGNDSFQYSINLQYDLNKLIKINSYIPTSESINLLNMYLKSIYYDSKERATVLVGPYGKGKSHLLLILSAIISIDDGIIDEDNNLLSDEVLQNLSNKIGNISKETEQIIRSMKEQNIKLLPVIVNSNYSDLNQAFLIALKDALDRSNLLGLIPNTYFDAIRDTVENWKNKFRDTYKLFMDILKEFNLTIREFNNKIRNYDEESYEIFKEIYPKITSGAVFNPMINSDIVKLYEEVNFKLCEQSKYSGMFIIFDEFSKFIESSTMRNSAMDLKIIQDFAELVNRSGNHQLHLACITHKSVDDYISSLPKERIDSWRAIEGRFKEIYFTSSSQQNYELISNAIIKDCATFKSFMCENSGYIEAISNNCSRIGLFEGINDYNETIIEGCFPLNPVATYCLPRVSEKVAQNERTIFTFLSRDEKGSLMRFVNKHQGKIELLTIDWIYDYFETLFKKEVFNQSVHDVWIKCELALKKVTDKYQRNIIKAIAIIYIVNEIDKLAPIDSVIQASLGVDSEEYKKSISTLVNKHILIKKKNNNFYRFTSSSSINLEKTIEQIKELKVKSINIRETLEEIIDSGYTLPKKYNDEREMTRFFKNAFITIDELLNISDVRSLLDIYKSDGIILNFIYNNEEEKLLAINKLKSLNNKRILICIPNGQFNKKEELEEYKAIQYLKKDEEFINSDDYAFHELSLYESEIIEGLEDYINSNFNILYENCRFYDCSGEIRNIKRPSHVNRKVSEICNNVFSRTPIINNEMINKMKLSGPIIKARNKIINYIFEGLDNEDGQKLEGKGPEVTIFRATIENKNLVGNTRSDDIMLNTVLDKIEKFILSAENIKSCFKILYDELCGEGYGLRLGIIPIYLAFKMKDYKESIVVYFGDKEVALSAETLNRINENPATYSLLVESGTKEKTDYIKNLEDLFKHYRSKNQVAYNRFSSIVDSMQSWIQSLPKYTREYELIFFENKTKEVDRETILLRKEILKHDINPREFLFERLSKKILKEESIEQCFVKVKNIKEELDNHLNNLKKTLILKVKNVFDKDYNGELGSTLNYWYINLNESCKKHVSDETTNKFLNYVSSLSTYDDNVIIERIARIVVGLNIEDWNDEALENFAIQISKIYGKVINYADEIAIESEKAYEISLNVSGKKLEKSFEAQEISPIGSTLMNEIEQIIEDYADSIDANEKRNILMKLMEKFI